MAFLQISHVEIKGISACVPKRIERNRDYPYLSAEEIEKYIATIGVEQRHCAIHDGSICTSDLCFESAEKLLNELQWNRDEVGLLVFISHTADYKLPSTACILQDRLGLSKQCMAFDSPLGCSGFVYGLGIASSILQTGMIKKALLLVGNTQSFYASPEDQSTALLFGDGGSAIALEYNPDYDRTMDFHFYSDGSGRDALIVPDGGCRNPFTIDSMRIEPCEEGHRRNRLHEKMDGLEVFTFATRNVPKSLNMLLDQFSINPSDIDYLLLHQANRFLCEKIRKRMQFEGEKFPYNIDKFGNTSGTSIPLLMVTNLTSDLKTKSLRHLATGFGVGLSIGSVCFSTHHIICPELLYL